jgi:hypothetical protein
MDEGEWPGESRIEWSDSVAPISSGFLVLRHGDPRNAELEAEWWAHIRGRYGDQAADRLQRSAALSRDPRPLSHEEAAILWDAVAPLLRDMDATGQARPDIRADAHDDSGEDAVCGWIQEPGSTCGQGVTVWLNSPPGEQLCSLADALQDWAGDIQMDPQRRPWPDCPDHPGAHALKSETQDNVAVWYCPQTHQIVADIGTLGSAPVG